MKGKSLHLDSAGVRNGLSNDSNAEGSTLPQPEAEIHFTTFTFEKTYDQGELT